MAKSSKTSSIDLQLDSLHSDLAAVRSEIHKRVIGQEDVITETLTVLLAGGHGLLVGVPGLAKTLLVQTVGEVMGLSHKRIQCTPDLMPSDILGSEVLEENPESGRKNFRFIEGPVFCQLLMADELNRASPRTQSALLQAMQEKQVSVAGHTHFLPAPFHVLATQNPLEQEGTYPLPEAQLDRFMLQINVGYPTEEEERQMVLTTTSGPAADVERLFDGERLQAAQSLIRDIPVGEKLIASVVRLVRAARPEVSSDNQIRENLAWGAGPRAAQTLIACAKVRAVLDGRTTPSIDDIAALAPAAMRHRLQPSFVARAAGLSVEDMISNLLKNL